MDGLCTIINVRDGTNTGMLHRLKLIFIINKKQDVFRGHLQLLHRRVEPRVSLKYMLRILSSKL